MISTRPSTIWVRVGYLLIILTILACESTKDVLDPVAAELRIEGAAEGVEPRWKLVRPGDQMVRGVGDTTLTNLDPGNYRLVWEPVEGWSSPRENPVHRTLEKGSVETLSGNYARIEGPQGDLAVDPQPRRLKAPWVISGPDGFFWEGEGRGVMKKRAVGEYTITWQPVEGHRTPDPVTATLEAEGSIEFNATYDPATFDRQKVLTVVIDVSPDGLTAPWTLEAEDGTRWVGTGDRTFIGMPMSVYTLTWGEVKGYQTPQPNPMTIDPESGTSTLVLGR